MKYNIQINGFQLLVLICVLRNRKDLISPDANKEASQLLKMFEQLMDTENKPGTLHSFTR